MNTHPVAIQAKHRAERDRCRPTSTRRSRRKTSACSRCAASTTPTSLGRMASGVLSAADAPAGCTTADRDDRADRPGRHALAGRRPGQDEGPGRTRRTAARRRASSAPCAPFAPGVGMTGMRQAHRRDRVRDAADPRLRADRAGRLVQADRACRHPDRPGRRQRAGPKACRRTPTGSRSARASVALATAATARVAAAPSTPAPSSTRRRPASRPTLAVAHQSGETMAGTRTRLDPTALKLVADMMYPGLLGRHDEARRHRALVGALKYTGNAESGRRPADASGAGQRHRQLPDAHRAAVDAATAARTRAPAATTTRTSST